MDRGAIEETKTFSMDREAIEIAIKKKLKSSIDSLAVERCRDCLKTVFQEEKNTDMNTIKHVTQPRIQKTF